MKKFDKIIIVVMIIISIILGIILKVHLNTNIKKTYAEIKVDGKLYKNIILNKNDKKQTLTIKTKLGENLIEVENGGVRIIDADCPDKICVKDGFKDKAGDVLVCLPHKIIIQIKGETNKSDVDEVSH